MHKPKIHPPTKRPAVEQAKGLIQLLALEVFAHGPQDPATRVQPDVATGQPLKEGDLGELF